MVSNTQAPAHFYLYLNEDGSWVVAPSLSTLPGREILSQDSKVGMVLLIVLALTATYLHSICHHFRIGTLPYLISLLFEE